jgi:cyclophilin family peptidyl-prolyl cis-trans isomerase/HEAT repeat protein
MRTSIVAVALCVAAGAQAQSNASRVTSADERALLTQLVEREDRRQLPDAGDARHRGLASSNSYLRAFTVRGLGRLEKPEVLALIVEKLGDPSAEVRAAAADAVAQSVARGGDSVAKARGALLQHLTREADPAARAMTLESIGRLAQGSVEQVKATANAIAPSLSAPSVIERRGAIRGIFFLARKREARSAGAIPTDVTDKMFAMLDESASAGFTPTDRFNIAYALWGAVALSDQRSHRLFADHETMVRERGIVNFARSSDLPLIRAHLEKTLVDSSPIIRFRSISVYAQKLRATDGCAPLVALTRDRDVTVALGATDALSACRNDTAVAGHLRSMAEGLRNDDRWHLPAHALVSLSSVDSAAARRVLPRFMTANNFFVRMYAVTAAATLGDAASLFTLTRDPHPNVQAAAITALSRRLGHTADSVYVRALSSDDNQVLMEAATALKGSTWSGLAEIAKSAWSRRRARGWDTDHDGQVALSSLFTVGDVIDAARPTIGLPTFDEMAALEKVIARIEMADGAIITMKLHPFDAPTNAFRFARLARAGTFDGLTFHRVAPFFVVQGPSPNANEYSAPDKPFARDELGVSNVRGTVGLSTRGRDTGDGQIFVNTVDNVWLDHDYTVMATITSGLEAFDRMQEGARIRRITITP